MLFNGNNFLNMYHGYQAAKLWFFFSHW